MANVGLPKFAASNDAMFALFAQLCGQYQVRKPSKYIVSLLGPECENAPLSAERGREDDDGDEYQQVSSFYCPQFSLCEVVSLSDPKIVLGNSGVCILLELIREAPFIHSIDFSPLPSFFADDAFKASIVDGNGVISKLCDVAAAHPSITSINLRGQPCGTVAIKALSELLKRNGRIVEIIANLEHCTAPVANEFVNRLTANQSGENTNCTEVPSDLSPRLKELAPVDRKTSTERLGLQVLLLECDSAFGGGVITAEETQTMVLKARTVLLSECAQHCRGLRGDETNVYLVHSGELLATIGTETATLRRGDFFGYSIESSMFSGGMLSVKQRGIAYALPISSSSPCGKLIKKWNCSIETCYPALRHVAALQSLPLWTLMYCCIGARVETFTTGQLVLQHGQTFTGLHIVTEGSFAVVACDSDGPSNAVVFTCGDVFGEEALVCRHKSSSVDVVAGISGGTAVVLDAASSARHIVGPLRNILRVNTKTYCIHEAPSS